MTHQARVWAAAVRTPWSNRQALISRGRRTQPGGPAPAWRHARHGGYALAASGQMLVPTVAPSKTGAGCDDGEAHPGKAEDT